MDRAERCGMRSTRFTCLNALRSGAALLLAMALHPASYAESTLQTTASGSATIGASTHLDFRVTVLPSLGLSAQTDGVHIQANSGVLTLQHDVRGVWDGRTPAGSLQLRPRHQVIDTLIRTSAFAGSDLITIASP